MVPSTVYVTEDGRVFVTLGTPDLHYPRRPQSVPGWREPPQRARARRAYQPGGHVTDVHFTVSHRQPKLIAIDKQPNDDVMHLDRSGKADRLAGEPLDPRPQRQMFALDLLHVPLARIAQFIAVCSSAKPCEIAENLLVVSDLISRPQERLIHAGSLVRPSTLP